MLTIEDIIEIAKKNGAKVTKNSEGCGIGYTDDNGLFHNIDVKEVISKPVPIEITEGIKAISEYCNAISGCDECALKYKKQCLLILLLDIGQVLLIQRIVLFWTEKRKRHTG